MMTPIPDCGLEPPESTVNKAEHDLELFLDERRERDHYEAADYYYEMNGDR